jgi:hypothetical protein
MKALLKPADIHTDDEGTGLALIHADSRGRKDYPYNFFFLLPESERREGDTQGAGPPPAKKFRLSPFLAPISCSSKPGPPSPIHRIIRSDLLTQSTGRHSIYGVSTKEGAG